MSPDPDIPRILKQAQAFVTYSPLRPEVPWQAHLALPAGKEHRIEPRASLDPALEALAAMEAVDGLPAAVLIPGRRFDALGTRLGQGGGWYDRFLSRVPASWTRIGFCFDDQFSSEPLPRQAWDEPVDYVVIISRQEGTAQVCETRSRL